MARPRVVRLYESSIASGNAYKVRLLMAHLGLECEIVALDILANPSETRRAEFLEKNPNGRIPVVELSDGTFLACRSPSGPGSPGWTERAAPSEGTESG
jgi:glutathione S-transferase